MLGKQEITEGMKEKSALINLKNEEESRRIPIGHPRRGNIDYGVFKFSTYKYYYSLWFNQ